MNKPGSAHVANVEDGRARQLSLSLPSEVETMRDEELAILAAVRRALVAGRERAAAMPRPLEIAPTSARVELRDQAATASESDLPAFLTELDIQQRLAERPLVASPLPPSTAPYLAHVRVREGSQSKDYLLGHVTFFDLDAGIRIVDWRIAPVAQIFYRYREGDEYEEELPGRVATGVVEARRIVVFDRGELVRILGDRIGIERAPGGQWRLIGQAHTLSSGGAGAAARPGVLGLGIGETGRTGKDAPEITALLDAEQYAAVTAPPEEPLLVLGSAGSGKTTVALHRLSRTVAIAPDRYPLAASRVIVPEEGLARLTRRLLKPLGAGDVVTERLDAFSLGHGKQAFGRRLPVLAEDLEASAAVIGLKRHPALYRALRKRFAETHKHTPPYAFLRRQLADVFTDKTFLLGVIADAGGDLYPSATDETVRHTMQQIAALPDRELADITDEERKQALDGRAVWEGTPAERAGTIDAEDIPILLCMRSWSGHRPGQRLKQLVLDEAEDFSLFELEMIGQMLAPKPSVTLAGDEAQQTSSSFAGWDGVLGHLGVAGATTCRLATSYRCPRPVAELAHQVLGPLGQAVGSDGETAQGGRAARDGVPVGFFQFPTEAQGELFVARAVRDLLLREPAASIAVITNETATAKRFAGLMADVPEAHFVVDGDFSFEPGLDITDVDQAKGLEFDYVILPDVTGAAYPATAEARRRLHVAITRTSHQLWLVSGKAPSPLLPKTLTG